jgi:hypothetical protein
MINASSYVHLRASASFCQVSWIIDAGQGANLPVT